MNAVLPLPEICERARLARDARFDGLFFTAVTSTGIYCRPVCPAPAPKPVNVRYFPSAELAAASGFRPCLRCRPELAPQAMQHRYQQSLVDHALALIAAGAMHAGSVATLAARIGVSPRQLRRLFVQVLGTGPMAVHSNRRLLLARQLLAETTLPMSQVALAAGYNSQRRFNAAFARHCGMPPMAVRRSRPATGDALVLRMAYRPPYDFPLMLAFLRKRAIPGIELVADSSYTRVLGPVDHSSWIRVTADDTRNELLLEITGADPQAIPDIVHRTRCLFDLDADLRPVVEALSVSPLLRAGMVRRPGLRVPGCWDGFELAVRAVLGQQVSVVAATTLSRRLVEQYGTQRAAPAGQPNRVFPAPEIIANAVLENLGITRQRAATLRALAQALLAGDLCLDPGQPLPQFVKNAVALPGIGPWTANYIAMRALRHPDAFPAGDLILQQMLGGTRRLSERETDACSQAWRPWRAYAVLHLWHLAGDPDKEDLVNVV